MQKKMSKKRLAFILVAVCLVGLIGIGISYSYYLANVSTSNEENKNSNITTTTITNVVMDMQGKVSSDGAYPGHKVVKEVIVRGIGEDNSIPANASIQITPDLGYFSEDVTWKLYKSEEVISCSNKFHNDNGFIYEEGSCDIPSTASLELGGGASSSYKNIVVNPNTETKYYLVVEYNNNEEDEQNWQQGESFSIDIGIGEKVKTQLFTKTITDLATTDTTNIAVDDPDGNTRYIGSNPDNYVYFNCSDYSNQMADTCELWRVVGVFNNVTKSDGTKENLVKIIRNESLNFDEFTWDYKQSGVGTSTTIYGSNDWTDSQLMMMLNPNDYLKNGYTIVNDVVSDTNGQEIYSKMGSYYNGTKGCKPASIANGAAFSCAEVDFTSTGLKNDVTRNAIENVVWNLGGASYSSKTVADFYTAERGTFVYNNHATTWDGKIGLMYPSDYGYATSGGTTKDRAACLAKELSNWHNYDSSDFNDCKENDYLYAGSWQWTMTPSSEVDAGIFAKSSLGVGSYGTEGDMAIRPVLFLKSNFFLRIGKGSWEEPYQLDLTS